MKKILIIGAGGHAQVIADILQQTPHHTPLGYLDDNPTLHHKTLLGLPVLGSTQAIATLPHDALIIAIGNNHIRQQLAHKFTQAGAQFINAIHPSATLSPSTKLGTGNMISAGAILNTATHIGNHVIINTGATIDHHTHIADAVHVAPGVHTGGDVTIHTGAFIGLGANIMPQKEIGAWATIGAGTLVHQNIPPRQTVVGVPARPLKK